MVPKLGNRSGYRNHAVGRNMYSWEGVRVTNILLVEIGSWLHSEALEVKSQTTVELIQTLINRDDADARGVISSEGEEEDDSKNDSLQFLHYV